MAEGIAKTIDDMFDTLDASFGGGKRRPVEIVEQRSGDRRAWLVREVGAPDGALCTSKALAERVKRGLEAVS